MKPGRRRFLQVGIAGVAVLAAARLLHRPGPDAPMVEALAAVILDGALPAEPDARAAALRQVAVSVEAAVAGLDPAARDEVARLFALLRFAPTRYLLTGIAAPLERAAPRDIAAFLEGWRASRFDLLRAGYQGLTQLVQAGWYDEPRAWAFVGYPGPPPLAA